MGGGVRVRGGGVGAMGGLGVEFKDLFSPARAQLDCLNQMMRHVKHAVKHSMSSICLLFHIIT